MNGYVVMSRDALEHHLLQDGERFRAWFWLIAHAAWKPHRTRIKGQTIALDRGELTFSQRFLAEQWGWSKSRVDRFIADLRAEGMIETRSKSGATAGHNAGQGQSIITICNYRKYQDVPDKQRGNSEPESGATAGQQRGKEEEGNNIPLPNGNGAADSRKHFWDHAKGYLGPSKASMVGRWAKTYGQDETAKAITAAQIANAVDPVPYIERILRGASKEAVFDGPC